MSYHQPPGFNLLPDVVKNLLIINGLFFLATIVLNASFGLDLVKILGLYFPMAEQFEPYQFVTHLFMHGGVAHIFFNMFALFMFGSLLENVIGPKRFFIYYFVTGFGAALLHLAVTGLGIWDLQSAVDAYAQNPGLENFRAFANENVPRQLMPTFTEFISNWQENPQAKDYTDGSVQLANQLLQRELSVPTVGASGAVYGLLLAFGLLFPNSYIYIYFLFPLKAKYFVMIFGAIELYSGITSGTGSGIAHFAHLGGMLFGYLLIKYWGLQRFN